MEDGQCSDQDYYEDYERDDRRVEEEETPNKTIMLRGLGPQTDKNDVRASDKPRLEQLLRLNECQILT
jgi:hypothetical protein